MENPVVLVAGASSGIGSASAIYLAKQGYRVILAARRLERLEEISKRIHEDGGETLAIQTDISQLDQIHNLVNQAIQVYGRIDVLINSAGYGKLVWLDEQSPEEISHQIQVNLTGAIQLIQAVLADMQTRGEGQIIQITSIASWVGIPTYSIYVANKFGLRGFLESLQREMRGTGIIISGVYPGSVDTEFDQHAGIEWKFRRVTPDWLMVSPEYVAKRIHQVIIKKRRFSVIPWFMVIPGLANTILPGLVGWILSKFFYRVGGKTVAWGNKPE